jgi:Na+/proline symporter/signal transduction histidine kinase
MNFLYLNIDIIIFISFLVVNLLTGIWTAKIRNIREYAIGNRDFSTITISITIIATWISGSRFLTNISKVYTEGIFYIIPSIMGHIITWLIICYFLAPRMGKFLGALSISEAMGNLYDQKVKFISCIIVSFCCIVEIAVQFYIASAILQLLLNFSSFYAILTVAMVVIIYSTIGGIRAVTFTDIVQFVTFSSIIPIIALVIWQTFADWHIIVQTISQSSVFNFSKLFDYNAPNFWQYISVLIYFSFPTLNPAIFQRILMAKDTKQIASSFSIAFWGCLCISIMFIWMGIVIIASNQNINHNELLAYIINNSNAYIGFKGIVAVGILSMIMSTIDSYINVTAITISYDLPKSLGKNLTTKYNLPLAYLATIITGLVAFTISLYIQNLLDVFLVVASFYASTIMIPLLLPIIGFHTSSKCVIIGMIAGIVTVLIWYLLQINYLYAVVPGILANIIFLIISHYLLRQTNSFSSNKESSVTNHLINSNYKNIINKFYNYLKEINTLKFCRNNLPNHEITYSYLGFFIILVTNSSFYIIPQMVVGQYITLYNVIHHTQLIIATIFLSIPIWSKKYKNKNFIAILWLIGIFYSLIFSSCILVIISDFNKLQIVIFMINLIIAATLLKWHTILIAVIIGIFASVNFYQQYYNDLNHLSYTDLQYKVIYFILLFTAILVFFLRPKQRQQELTEAKNSHLGKRIYYRDQELQKLLDLKYEFLRNINHEIYTPMTGVTSLAETLWEKYDQLSAHQRKQAAEIIVKSSRRLNSLMSNILDFSKLSSLTYELNKQPMNLSELIDKRVNICKKLYQNNKELTFIIKVEENIIIDCDKYYFQQTLDNLIINSITYTNKGDITINLKKTSSEVKFTILDDGIGVPTEELQDIFGVFVVSSKTRTPAGGRGVGLALCKKVIEVHGGKIWAKNNQDNKTMIIFTIPLSQ